jgi:putative ABC transport system permease protein
MFSNYLKIVLRNIAKYKGFSFINIFGLALGLACCLLISMYIRDELSYDKYHENSTRIYRVTRDWVSSEGKVDLHLGHVAPPFGPLLQNDFPDIEAAARLLQSGTLFRYDEKAFNEDNVFIAEPSIFKIFTIPVLSGSPDNALNEPFSVMLSDKIAAKYFGDENPVGKVLRMDNQYTVKVTGVFESFPPNSHFHPEIFLSFTTLNDENIYGQEGLRTNFSNNSFATYLLLPENYPTERLTSQFPAFIDKHMGSNDQNATKPSTYTHLYLQKLTDIHLHSHLDSEIEPNGNITTVYILIAIAIFILIIACINFMNLSTALAVKRAKEVGIRKVMGVTKSSLVTQFLSESVVFALVSLVLAIGIVHLALPALNTFTGRSLTMGYIQYWYTIPALLLLALLVGLLAGSYPAVYLSSFQPVSILKGKLLSGAKNYRGGITLRQVLVVGQFAISIILMICTGVMFNQLQYIQNKSLGFEKEHMVTLPFYDELGPQYEAFKNELRSSAAVNDVGRSSRIPSDRLLDSQGGATILNGDSTVPASATLKDVAIDQDFIPTYKIDMVAGRNFSKDYSTDTTAFIINVSAAKSMGFTDLKEAIGKQIQYGNRKGLIVGVVQDFNFESVHQSILPMIFTMPSLEERYNDLSIKVNGANLKEGLAHIEKVWNRFLPQRPYEYSFLDERFGLLYEREQKQSQLFTTFSVLAILIGCLGLFGLASFTALQRTKEIGVRKVLGASVTGIVGLLSKEFLKLVLVANLIAWPVAWYAMSLWLDDFAYKISINPLTFVIAAILALLIALLTVSYQSIKAALTNPVTSLRSE